MTNKFSMNVIWIVMKQENFEDFEGRGFVGIKRSPDKAFVHLGDAINYIMEQNPVVMDCWKFVGEGIDHTTDYRCERQLLYETEHNEQLFYKDICYDIVPVDLIEKES